MICKKCNGTIQSENATFCCLCGEKLLDDNSNNFVNGSANVDNANNSTINTDNPQSNPQNQNYYPNYPNYPNAHLQYPQAYPQPLPQDISPIPHGFKQKASFAYKGKFSIFANVVVGILLVGAFIATVLIFWQSMIYDLENNPIRLLLRMLLVIATIIGYFVLSFCIPIIFFKASGAGKLKLHIGGVLTIYPLKPIGKNISLAGSLVAGLLPVVIFSVLIIFFWLEWAFLGLAFSASTLLTNIPLYIFLFKLKKPDLLLFNNGTLYAIEKDENSEIENEIVN